MTERKRREMIQKLRAVVVSRGATPSEELAAKNAIARLESRQVETDPRVETVNSLSQLLGGLGGTVASGTGFAGGGQMGQQQAPPSQQQQGFPPWVMDILRQAGMKI